MATPLDNATRARIRRLAWLLDMAIAVPGTRWRVGIDGLLGLIPGVGDLVGLALSLYVVWAGAQSGAPPAVLGRMALNLAVEAVAGLVPVLGDLFDFAWKANMRNLRLLEGYLARPRPVLWSSRVLLVAMAVGLLAAVGGAAWLGAELVVWVVRSLGEAMAGAW